MTDNEIIDEIDAQRDLMISVATGRARIQDVDDDYKARRQRVRTALADRKIDDPNPHSDLWRWYGKWSNGDLPTYQSRRMYVADLYDPLVDALKKRAIGAGRNVFEEPTGWARVDRAVDKLRSQLEKSLVEEDYQVVGLLGREVLISLAQAVYDPIRHCEEGVSRPSETDAKRMLDAYVSNELGGSSNEETRKHIKAAIDLANSLQHRRTATFRDAAVCAEATTATVNIVAIVYGRRDPGPDRS